MAQTPEQTPEQPRKKLPAKTLLMLLAVLIVEAVAISAVFLMAGGPAKVQADGAAIDAATLAQQPVEELIISDRFQNTRSGKMFLYDTEVYIVIRRKHQAQVQEEAKNMQAAISMDIGTIFRRAEPSHLTEPTLATLKRQIKAALDARFKKDEEGNSVVQEVLIRKCTQLPLF